VRRTRALPVIKPALAPQSAINVTPLVDVVLVLLIIFMVIMPVLDKNFRVHLPQPTPVATERELPAQILVRVDAAGRFHVNERPVLDEAYETALGRLLAERAPAERVVFVSAEPDAGYARLIAAFEGARHAGADKLALHSEGPVR